MAVYKDKLIKEYIQELKPGTKVTFEEKDTYDNSSKVRNGEVVAVNGDKCKRYAMKLAQYLEDDGYTRFASAIRGKFNPNANIIVFD